MSELDSKRKINVARDCVTWVIVFFSGRYIICKKCFNNRISITELNADNKEMKAMFSIILLFLTIFYL